VNSKVKTLREPHEASKARIGRVTENMLLYHEVLYVHTLGCDNRMKQQVKLLWLIIMVSCVIFGGCTTSKSDKDKFIGSWEGTYSWAGNLTRRVPTTITFFSDGTYSATLPLIRDNGTWDITNGALMKTADSNPAVAYAYSFSNNNQSLILTSSPKNDQWNLTKQ